MCLAIPAKIVRKESDFLAEADIMGVSRQIALDLTPQAQEGDYVLLHAGFAIEVVDQTYAQETLELIKQFPDLVQDDISALSASGQEGEEE